MRTKFLMCMMSLVIFCFYGVAQGQDPCQSYHDSYRVCVEKSDAGRKMDYHNVCKRSPCNDSENDCNNCGCYWRADKAACMTDICISENSGDGMVSAPDYGALKKEFLRISCPTTPDVPAEAPVEWTGVTLCYDETGIERNCSGTGEDGEHKKGVDWPLPRFADNGDGTIKVTGLTWLEDANCIATTHSTYNFDNDGDGAVSWPEALDFVAGINDGTYSLCGAGKTDWRLPNIKELSSLIDFSQYDPALPWLFTLVVDNEESYRYWSSTTLREYPTSAWDVDIGTGRVSNQVKASNAQYVWPVRGGQD